MHFNKELIDKLKTIVPPRVAAANLKWESDDGYKIVDNCYGWVRFDNGVLDSIYVEVRAMSWDPMAYDDNFAIIKFVKDANNKDGWVFKKIYKFPEENIEVVYDDKLEELGEYVEHPNWEKDNFGEDCIICTKYDKDEKIINSYTSYKGFRRGKTFPFFVQQLKDNTILDGDYSTDYRWYHFWKTDNTEIKYLVLNPPFEILHEEEGNDGKIIHEVKD